VNCQYQAPYSISLCSLIYTQTTILSKIFIDSVEDYARQWEKREKEDLDTLSEWMKSVRSLIQIRIKKLIGSMSTRSTSAVIDNFKVTSYNMTSWIIYEWETCTGAVRSLIFEIVNIEITQHMFVIKHF
jgi:hypothetical protein